MRALSPIAAAVALTAALTGCGGAPPEASSQLDVLDDVYLRGAPAPSGPGRVALTFDGPSSCTDALLGRLHAPRGGAAGDAVSSPLTATFFVDPGDLTTAAERDAGGLQATLERLVADGHGLALRVDAVPAAWRSGPAAMRQGLTERTRATQALLAAHGLTATPPLALWRPPAIDPASLALGAAVERPMVLWTLRLRADADLDTELPQLIERLSDGDIVALPGGGAGCPAVDALPRIAAGLAAAGLATVTLDEMLGGHLSRYAPPQLVRYRGPGLPPSCRSALDLPPATAGEGDPRSPAIRWGLVHRSEASPVVLPVPDVGPQTDAVLGARAQLDHLWRTRRRWSGLPACLHRVTSADLLAPISVDRAQTGGRIGWWSVGERVERRDARVIGRPSAPVELPARADLARVEARQRLPGPVRGVVAQALERVDLDLPVLMELQPAGGVVVGAALTPADVDDPVRLQRAVAGYVQVAELSMGEYLYLARTHPRTSGRSRRAARGGDGFLRPGPHLVLARPGLGPDPRRLGIDGRDALPIAPATLLARVLAAGHSLAPGDVVAIGLEPVQGAPLILPPNAGDGLVATLRSGLVHAVLAGTRTPLYLRPGSTRRLDGALLGVQWVRLVVPAGVAAPTAASTPLVEVAPRAADDGANDSVSKEPAR